MRAFRNRQAKFSREIRARVRLQEAFFVPEALINQEYGKLGMGIKER